MRVPTSYHNHSKWSDGASTISEMVEAAAKAGFQEFGISDHLVLTPSGEVPTWSIARESIPDYVASACDVAERVDSLQVRVGIEADYIPETTGILRELLATQPFDYVVGSVHYLDRFPIDEHARYWDALSPHEIDAQWRLYWLRIREMAETGLYDVAAHLDLPKKFGHRPSVDLSVLENAALDAIAAAGMVIEINVSGWMWPAREEYPSPSILTRAFARGIPLVISADAHAPAHVSRHFPRAAKVAWDIGWREVCAFDRRERRMIPL